MSARFTPEMKKTHTILVPDMLPIHFQLLISILKPYGYNCELLQTAGAACYRAVYGGTEIGTL